MAEKKKYLYSTPHSDGFTLNLCGKVQKAENKVITLNQDEHDELQELITEGKRSDLAHHVRLIDTEMAEKVAKAYLEQKAQAGRGTAASDVLKMHKDVVNPDTPKVVINEANEKPQPIQGSTLAERIAVRKAGAPLGPTDPANPNNANSVREGTPENPIEEEAFHPEPGK